MLNSINTNAGAFVALQNLNATNRELGVVQNRINTGQKVASAKDSGAIWSIAAGQSATAQSLNSVKNAINRGKSIVDVAVAAGDVMMETLKEMREVAVGIESTTGSTQAKYQADFTALQAQLSATFADANFDGANLFTAQVTVRTGPEATDTYDLAGTFAAFTGAVTAVPQTAVGVDAAITELSGKLSTFGTSAKYLDRQSTFIGKLQDSLETGVGNLVDADLAKESARLTALQTKQQLGIQALSIANQSSSTLLSLFR